MFLRGDAADELSLVPSSTMLQSVASAGQGLRSVCCLCVAYCRLCPLSSTLSYDNCLLLLLVFVLSMLLLLLLAAVPFLLPSILAMTFFLVEILSGRSFRDR